VGVRRRHGLSVLEVTLALLVLTVAIGGLAQLLATAAAHRRTSDQRRLALQEVANQAERIALWSYDELTAEKLGGLAKGDDLAAALPAATFQATLTDEAGPPASKRVRLEVHWTDAAGNAQQPVGLTIWKHRPEVQP
jgi:Tfp pilus assembly protein PilV